jgi:hypothetical protein
MPIFRDISSSLGADILRLERVFEEAEDNPDELTEWEQEFLESLSERIEQYGDRTRISVKQWAVIERIEGKLGI